MPVRRKRYNWKARQQKHGENSKYEGNMSLLGVLEDVQKGNDVNIALDDSNALVLPSKRKHRGSEDADKPQPKLRKLSSRQRKRLEKIVEAKEKKSRVGVVEDRHINDRAVIICTYT